MAEAPGLVALYNQYVDQGFIVITLIGETESGGAPTQADLGRWADRFGIEHPVVADPGYGVAARFVTGSTIGLPTMTLLAPGAEITVADGHVTAQHVLQALP